MTMEIYYRDRAPEYDKFYEVPERQCDLKRLKSWLVEHVRGRHILEIAAGTGYWTEAAIAAARNLGSNVKLRTADAFALPKFGSPFDAGMAHMWWSHVGKERRQEFLSHFVSRLEPRAAILMIDQVFGGCSTVSRQDEWGNLMTLRTLENGATFEIIKNYPSSEELCDDFAKVCDDVEIILLPHFWALSAHVRAPVD